MPTLADALVAVHEAVVARFGASDNSVAFVFEAGTPIPLSALAEPTSAALSPARALEYMSRLANAVPDLSGSTFRASMRTVDGQYRLVLTNAQPIAPDQAVPFGDLKRDAVQRFGSELGSVEGPGTFHPVVVTPSNWYDPANQESWSHVHVASEERPDGLAAPPLHASLLDWHRPAVAARAAAGPAVFQTLPPATVETKPHPTTAASFATDVLQGSTTAPVIVEFWAEWSGPSKLMVPLLTKILAGLNGTIRWFRVNIDDDNALAEQSAIRGIPCVVAFMNGQAVDRFVGASEDGLRAFLKKFDIEFIPTGTNRMVVDFDMNVVHLDRPWMSEAFLGARTWFVSGLRKGDVSDGQSVLGPGTLNAVPIACVIARDLSIVAEWTAGDRSVMADASHLGPFALAGHDFEGGSGTLTIKGMQVIGWVCGLTPLAPPASDPALA